MAGHVNGTVHLRPARAGLLVTSDEGGFVRAVEMATSAWGGRYFPIFDFEEQEPNLEALEPFSLDFLHAVDPHPDLETLDGAVGYRYRGGAGWGPFDASEGRLSNRLIDPTWLLPTVSRHPRSLPRWADDDPLSAVFAAWFGRYGQSDFERTLETLFVEDVDRVEVSSSEPLPDLSGPITPIKLTGADIHYTGDGETAMIIVFRPEDSNGRSALWNMRACGANVFPWPLGYEDAFSDALRAWLAHSQQNRLLGTYQSGDGTDRGQYVGVLNLAESQMVPDRIMSTALELDLRASAHGPLWPRGWTDVHPMSTDFRRTFSLDVSNQDGAIRVPIPHAEPVGGWREHRPGIVALDVIIYNETGRPGSTLAVPRIRQLSALFQDYLNTPEPFHRPSGEGRILGVDITEYEVGLAFIESTAIFSELFEPDLTCSQSNNGKVTGRLIEILGGSSSTASNQPSIRGVLTKAGASPRGKSLPALIETARHFQGSWPGPFSSQERGRQYPATVTKWLISKKILKPMLPMNCPHCSTEAIFTAEDLSTVVECELCSESFPLGFALAQTSRNEWLYRITGNLDPKQLAETLPVMAAMSILSGYRRLSTGSLPNVLGLKVSSGRNWSCELDIAAFVQTGGPSAAIVGEVKGGRDPIDQTDIENLVRVQDLLRSKNIECVILGATLREQLDQNELLAFRKLCESAPMSTRRGQSGVVLPIVLTRTNLSVPLFHDDHPLKWSEPGSGLSGLATESCRRNLGLVDVQPELDGAEWKWKFTWRS